MPRERKGEKLAAQLGLFGAPVVDNTDDAELEAELRALQGESSPDNLNISSHDDKALANWENLDKMVSESMKEAEDVPVTDAELSDESLLNELSALVNDDSIAENSSIETDGAEKSESGEDQYNTLISTLNERIELYQRAIAGAEQNHEGSKARRYKRGLTVPFLTSFQTLKQSLSDAKKGKVINVDTLPPVIAPPKNLQTEIITQKVSDDNVQIIAPTVLPLFIKEDAKRPLPDVPGAKTPATMPSSAKPPTSAVLNTNTTKNVASNNGSAQRNLLVTRRDEYKNASLIAKHNNDKDTMLKYFKIAKQFDNVIAALDSGQEIDLSAMPPSLAEGRAHALSLPHDTAESVELPQAELPTEQARKLFNAPKPTNSTLEALEQRFQKYKSAADDAKKSGAGSKARRMDRIAKQYSLAIKNVKAGKEVDFDALPTPPGFPPIPPLTTTANNVSTPIPPVRRAAVNAASPRQTAQVPAREAAPSPPKRQLTAIQNQQLRFLVDRQKQFRQVALSYKKKGQIGLAKKYLAYAKGCDPMIEASRNGLPVDLTKLPPLPGARSNMNVKVTIPGGKSSDVSLLDTPLDTDDTEALPREQMYHKLEETLVNQVKMCGINSEKFLRMGDMSAKTNFEKWATESRRDLDSLRNAFKHDDPVPRFHYENREFTSVQVNHELGDNDMDLYIIKGVQFPTPEGYRKEDLDTYVKYALPFPSDAEQTGATKTVKGTNEPQYDCKTRLMINRKSRAMQRVIEKKALKFEIFYKRGFFHSDRILATCSLSLSPLQTTCIDCQAIDLMEGRKALGGKLEVKLVIREPFNGRPQIELIKEKWLVLDEFKRKVDPPRKRLPAPIKPSTNSMPSRSSQGVNRTVLNKPIPSPRTRNRSSSPKSASSMAVLQFEINQLNQQLNSLKLNDVQRRILENQMHSMQADLHNQQYALKKGGSPALQSYVENLHYSLVEFKRKASELKRMGDDKKAQIMWHKYDLVDAEIHRINQGAFSSS